MFNSYSTYMTLKHKASAHANHSKALVPGRNHTENVRFTKQSLGFIMGINIMLFISIIMLSGDVHPNPGPDSLSRSFSSNNNSSSVFNHNLNIIHLNIQSILPKMDILEAEMQNYDILVFTETWLSPQTSDDDILITNFEPPYRRDRQDRIGGGVAIYTRTGIQSVRRHDLMHGNIEALCIEVSIKSHTFLICGLYRPPNTGQDYWDLIELSFDNLSNSPINDLVILGDFNCDLMKPASANKINNISLSYNLHQLINEATHYTENSSSLIDLIFVSKPENVIYSDVTSPFIPDLVRYHCPVILTLKFRKPRQKSFTRHIWLYEKGDYDKYRRLLEHTDWDFISPRNNVNEIADKVTDLILKAAQESIPNKIVTIRPNEPQWINAFIKRQIRQRKRLFKIAKRVNNENAWTKFRQKRNSVTSIIRQAKKQYNDKLASELRNNEHQSKSWYKVSSHFLKTSSDSNPIPYLEIDNKIAETDIEKAEILNKYFASQSTIDDRDTDLPDLDLPNYPPLETINISQDDVKDVISLIKPHKAPGPNLISPKLIKEAKTELAYPFSKLFNLSLTLKEFPDSWKKANVTAIHKKDDRCLPSNYRPISLLNYEGKLMERCVHKHVSQYLIQHSIISEYQSGFQSGDSTVNQLTYLYNEFSKALDENKEIRVVFLDISKAFDRVWHRGLLIKLRAIGFSENIIDWFSSYLRNRQQRVCIRGQSSSWRNTNAGVPQGSILGPILFLLFINDIVNVIKSSKRLFADDTIIYKIVENNYANLVALELNLDLENIPDWATDWRVDFNPLKTKSLIISKKRLKTTHPALFMKQTRIDEVTQHKHLGIVFSEDLSWTNHINTLSSKAWKRIGSLRRYKFLLDRASLQKMYVTFVRPLLEYGDIVWDNCSVANKRTLESVQVEALRITTGGTKVCSIQKLYDDSQWETLQKRRYNHKLCQLYKIIHGLTPNYLHQLLPSRVQQSSRYPLRNSNDFSIPASRTTSYCNSFLPATLRDWNALSQDIRDAQSLYSFKMKLKIPVNSPKCFDAIQISRLGQILHARLRLECSSLNHHLFQKNLVNSPLCSCGLAETTYHFLLYCTKYDLLRQRYLSVLPHHLSLALLLNGDPNESDQVNNIIFKHVQLYILATKRFT